MTNNAPRTDINRALVNIDAEGKQTVFFLDDYRPKTKGRNRLPSGAARILHHKSEDKMPELKVYPGNADRQTKNAPEQQEDDLNERMLAREFAAAYPQYCYVPKQRRWMIWEDGRWQEDELNKVLFSVGEYLEERTLERKKHNHWQKTTTIAAVERQARVEPAAVAKANQWDTDYWLLNTPDGTVELRTGMIREARAEDYITRTTAVGPANLELLLDIGEACPRWSQFLDEITAGNQELIAYLQRMVGYFLTGSTREHAVFFSHGTGTNGKTVFHNTVSRLLSSYAKTAGMETFTESKHDRHLNELARLHNVRLVVAGEVEEGRHWAENKLKWLTGGDTVTARFMYGEHFEYKPQFKLAVMANHKPYLHNVDPAIRRRFNLIPFTVTIPEDKRDPRLEEKLREELPGILSWAIQGCLDWQEEGLNPPPVVRDATEQYFSEQDAIAQWLEEECIVGPHEQILSTKLQGSWQAYAKKYSLLPGRPYQLKEKLHAKGICFDPKKRLFLGVSLPVSPDPREID